MPKRAREGHVFQSADLLLNSVRPKLLTEHRLDRIVSVCDDTRVLKENTLNT